MCQVSDPDHNKGKTSYEVESDVEPLILQTFGDLQAFYEDSKDDLKDVTKENEEHRNQTDKAIDSVMGCVEKINKARVDEHTTNRVSETVEVESALKATMQTMAETNTTTSGNIIKSLKDDLEFNQRLLIAAEGYIQNSARLTEITISLNELNFPSLQTRITNIENTQVTMPSNIASIKTDTSTMKEMVIEMFNAFNGPSSSNPSSSATIPTVTPVKATITVGGENFEKHVVVWQKPPSYTEGVDPF
ncbi:hypothetical protein Tco_1435915 [Tanacetum coccineum]